MTTAHPCQFRIFHFPRFLMVSGEQYRLNHALSTLFLPCKHKNLQLFYQWQRNSRRLDCNAPLLFGVRASTFKAITRVPQFRKLEDLCSQATQRVDCQKVGNDITLHKKYKEHTERGCMIVSETRNGLRRIISWGNREITSQESYLLQLTREEEARTSKLNTWSRFTKQKQ